ncbi:MAG: hypothetical protein DRQ13_12010 [Ignavibacteriae bacterium]|nr:MAG: hypothetical protein DRQ13_12010 [Ignavibacteriota bacterium]
MKRINLFHLLLLLLILNFKSSFAWVYPEHRDIALLAIQKLSPEYRSILDKLWSEARIGYEDRLTEAVIDATQSTNPQFLDYASWSAIGGDHSCSPENLLYNVLETDWILKVADVAAQLKIDIANSETRSEHINSIRDSDIKFQRVDPEYATRAGSNNAHFLLARPEVETDAYEYITACLKEGVELNALGVYSWFHVSALQKVARLSQESLTSEERSALILSALADEAFALHFLQDVYASGHVAGTWGDASQRKGTHDYYNEKGLEVTTWDGKRVILMGDAYMRPQDAELAAITIRLSIEQLLDVASGKVKIDYFATNQPLQAIPDSFNVCTNNFVPSKDVEDTQIKTFIADVLVQTPVPGLATGLGEMPRFRAELGAFIGVVPALRGATVNGGFGLDQNTAGGVGGIDVAIRLGIGLEGVLNESGDGLIYLDLGWRQDGPSTMKFGDSPALIEGGQITSAIPGRDAFILRLRMPFWLIPGDMILLAPILALTSSEALASVGVQAVNGGLIPWQAGIATSIGRFQFILGREIGITFYGGGDQKDALLIPGGVPTLITFKSTQLDFPILEYRPFRTFSLDQSSSLVIQLNAGVDIPRNETVVLPEGATIPELDNVWYIGMRFAFDWRYYY